MRRQPEIPAHHRRVVHALQSGGPAVPDSVLRHIAALEAKPARRPRIGFHRPVLAGGVAVALALAIAVVMSLGGPAGPSVVDAAQLSPLPSEGGPARGFAGVRYPDWSDKFGWYTVGGRDDRLGGRRTTTVFYRHTHHRIGYTVISGRTIEPPDDAEVLRVKGVVLHRFKLGVQDVVTFERNGRTCVLSGDVHDPDTLVKLASSE
jgi:hypothetical protein